MNRGVGYMSNSSECKSINSRVISIRPARDWIGPAFLVLVATRGIAVPILSAVCVCTVHHALSSVFLQCNEEVLHRYNTTFSKTTDLS